MKNHGATETPVRPASSNFASRLLNRAISDRKKTPAGVGVEVRSEMQHVGTHSSQTETKQDEK